MMLISRRSALRGLAAGALGLGALNLGACGRKKDADLAGVTLRAATYRGNPDSFFEQAGVADTPYTLETAQFAGGNLIAEAINAHSLDVGGMSEIPPIFIAAANPLVRIIAVLQGDVNNQVVLVPKDSPLQTTADLKGKRVGYVRATTTQYMLLKILKEQGLTFADITPVALSPQDGLAAFNQGSLDAWVIYGVVVQLAREGGARVLTTGLNRLSGNYLVAASKDALADPLKRRAITDYLQRYAKTLAWIEADYTRWARLRAQLTNIPEAAYLQEYRERSAAYRLLPVSDAAIASQQDVADTFAAAGVIPAPVDVRPLWDDSLHEVLAKL
ncbi:ABC transporter substrate-binding protein [Nitrospirillum pindoramense]|uniref:Putative aliphatic sulfonates-binding protein n=1 Tax=Nitrospirillum amazonense TaxID=28077 RepID=A0A560GUP3_9PROT|nr:ABC transporter substrate-binding protein [Nitrospirillum amazonense]TWB37521.1 sulfonate transport system substrate-binding protein [Nitrospirillum amazonense]